MAPTGLAARNGVHGHLLHLGALEVGAHAAGSVAAGEEQGVVTRCAAPRPSATVHSNVGVIEQ